jgi:spore coat polysaccharide biosynthesis predicted glycosyltransferase SpsG/CMP-N-acetylneuraminic acid synthetase
LIAYAIQNALDCEEITDVVVTTDDKEIADVASCYGSEIVERRDELARDDIPLDPVIYDALLKMEQIKGVTYDYVVTLQPTSPLMALDTLTKAVKNMISSDIDSLISVVNRPHLSWKKEDDHIVPAYEKRLNRQYLPPQYFETGAFLIAKRACVTAESRLGQKVSVYEVPARESVDIDAVEDWLICENILGRKRIVLRADGWQKIGMGHIYNCITMAFSLIGHEVLLVTREDCPEGLKKIQSTNLPYRTIRKDEDLDDIIQEFKPDIWVNDCLNTTQAYMRHLKKYVSRVISIEDLGAGTAYADAVINALYEEKQTECAVTYTGERYVCLRSEFRMEKPKTFSEKVKNILVMFGGTDPSNLNRKLYKAARNIVASCEDVSFHFVTGIGYDYEENGILTRSQERIYVHSNVLKVTEYMKRADLAVSSQGRTVYELACMGVPSIILAQNEREMTHTFATMKNGFINLGYGKNVSTDAIINTLKWLIDTPSIRSNMRDLMLKHDFRGADKRLKEIILGDGGNE